MIEQGRPWSVASRSDLEAIGRFLARRDTPSWELAGWGRTDVLVLCGSAVLAAPDLAARAFHHGTVGAILISGGTGHSTGHLRAAVRAHPRYHDISEELRPEGRILAEILQRHLGVPASALMVEDQSTNCGENAAFSLRLLREWPGARPRVLLVQDPTMQRRTHAAFDHHQRADRSPIEIVSFAPFVPIVTGTNVGERGQPPAWTLDRYLALALGEVRRLSDDEQGYGPRGKGYIAHVEVPKEILEATRRVRAGVPTSRVTR